MSTDSPALIVHRLIENANRFLRFLALISNRNPTAPGAPLRSELEIDAGRTARHLANNLGSLADADSSTVPVRIRTDIKPLRRLFFDLVDRWGWGKVIGPEGGSFLSDQEKLWKERRKAFLSAVRAYVEGCADLKRDERPERWHKDYAGLAESEGIPASMTFEDAKARQESLGLAWNGSPYLVPEFPTCTPDEYRRFESILEEIKQSARQTRIGPATALPPLQPKAVTGQTDAKPDPVGETGRMLGKAVEKARLVLFLAAREKREASLESIVEHFLKRPINNNNLRYARRRAELTRAALAEGRYSHRLEIKGNVVRLIDVSPNA
jgi:hypothetical protein